MVIILSSQDVENVRARLVEARIGVTQIASTGGYLRRGNTTLLVGTEENRVDAVLDLLRDSTGEPEKEGQRRATVFVIDVDRFDQI